MRTFDTLINTVPIKPLIKPEYSQIKTLCIDELATLRPTISIDIDSERTLINEDAVLETK